MRKADRHPFSRARLLWLLFATGCAGSALWLEPGAPVAARIRPETHVFVAPGDSGEWFLARAADATSDSFRLPLPKSLRGEMSVWLRSNQMSRVLIPLVLVPPDSLPTPSVNHLRVSDSGRLLDPPPLFGIQPGFSMPSIGSGLFVCTDQAAELRWFPTDDSLGAEGIADLEPRPDASSVWRSGPERISLPAGRWGFMALCGPDTLKGELRVEPGVYTVLGFRFGR